MLLGILVQKSLEMAPSVVRAILDTALTLTQLATFSLNLKLVTLTSEYQVLQSLLKMGGKNNLNGASEPGKAVVAMNGASKDGVDHPLSNKPAANVSLHPSQPL